MAVLTRPAGYVSVLGGELGCQVCLDFPALFFLKALGSRKSGFVGHCVLAHTEVCTICVRLGDSGRGWCSLAAFKVC